MKKDCNMQEQFDRWRKYVVISGLVPRGVQVDAMHPLQTWMHRLGICKISKTNMLISPLKNLQHSTVVMCCLWQTAVDGNNSFSKIYNYASCFCIVIECIIVDFVVLAKALPTIMHTQNNIHTICITEYYVHMAYKHMYAYVYEPALEATALEFMV
jgi:hypothetical protein